MKKNKVSVRLMGRDYSLLTDQPTERIQTLARYIDRKMRELQLSTHAPESMLPMLTLFTLGDELFSAQQENTHLKRELARLATPDVSETK